MSRFTSERLAHNWRRMRLLKALNKYAGPGREVEFGELQTALIEFNLPMSRKQLAYHLYLMAEPNKRWVRLRIGIGEETGEDILGVTLTDLGVDQVDMDIHEEQA